MTPLRFSFVAAFSLMALTVAALTSGGAGRAFPAPLATPQGGADLSSLTIRPSRIIGAIQTSADTSTSWRAVASREDLQRAQLCLTAAIYYEAASESEAGQRAVAQVVLNRARHPAWPATICGVVYQASDMPICQFSYSCDGSMARRPDRAGWDQAARIAGEALSGEVYRPVGLSTFYHTLSVDPRWNRAMIPTIVIGQHIFYRLPGRAGTEAAFDQRYTGGSHYLARCRDGLLQRRRPNWTTCARTDPLFPLKLYWRAHPSSGTPPPALSPMGRFFPNIEIVDGGSATSSPSIWHQGRYISTLGHLPSPNIYGTAAPC